MSEGRLNYYFFLKKTTKNTESKVIENVGNIYRNRTLTKYPILLLSIFGNHYANNL